jgi:hypothetical protein
MIAHLPFSSSRRSTPVTVLIVTVLLSLNSALAQFSQAPMVLGELPRTTEFAQLGQAMAVGDFNAKGALDLAVSNPVAKVLVFNGETSSPQSFFDATVDRTISGTDVLAGFGSALAAGDLNGDNKIDIIIGSPTPEENDTLMCTADGKTLVYYNKATPGRSADVTISKRSDEEFCELAFFGNALAVGDVNNDKVHDLIVGAPGKDLVQIFYGAKAPAKFGSRVGLSLQSPIPPDPSGFGFPSFGGALATGDVNSDGIADIIVGAPETPIGAGYGNVFIYFGADSTKNQSISRTPSLTIPNPMPTPDVYTFGATLSVGDFNGDGKADILVGDYSARVGGLDGAGKIYVYYGGAGILDPTFDLVLTEPTPQVGSLFGASLAIGDVTGDKITDVVAGAPQATVNNRTRAGRVHVFYGGMNPDTKSDLTLASPTPEEDAAFGTACIVADLNKDGKPDIVISSASATFNKKKAAGAVYFFRG